MTNSPESLKIARIKLGLTQADLAELAGISTNTVSNLERGENEPTEHTRQQIELHLGAIDWARTKLAAGTFRRLYRREKEAV